MKLKNTKEEQQEIKLIKAHYIAMLDEKNSMNAYTINSVNRLCKMLEIFNALADDIRKRGVNVGYNNGGGQSGNRQNDSIKLLENYESDIERLKKEIENYRDENVKHKNYESITLYDFRKYEDYFNDESISLYKADSETIYKELSIKNFCKDYGISTEVENYCIDALRNKKITQKDMLLLLKHKADALDEIDLIERYNSDELVKAVVLNLNKGDEERTQEEIEKLEIEDANKYYDNEENRKSLQECMYYDFMKFRNDKKNSEKIKGCEFVNDEVQLFFNEQREILRNTAN